MQPKHPFSTDRRTIVRDPSTSMSKVNRRSKWTGHHFPSPAPRNVRGQSRSACNRDRLASSRMVPSDKEWTQRAFPSSMRVRSRTHAVHTGKNIGSPTSNASQGSSTTQRPPAGATGHLVLLRRRRTKINHGFQYRRLTRSLVSDTCSSQWSERRNKLAHFQRITSRNRHNNTPTPRARKRENQHHIPQEARDCDSDTLPPPRGVVRSGSADFRVSKLSRQQREDSDRKK